MKDDKRHGQVADLEPKQIYLRGFAEERDRTLKKNAPFPKGRGSPGPSEWALLLDTETTTDSAQRLRIGSYQIRKLDELKEKGLFYDEAALSASEVITLRRFTKENGFVLRTHKEFLEQVFLQVGYWLRATIIGFNLPFDISRIAISHATARGSMRGGFSFQLSSSSREPRLQVKHLSARAALMRFTHPGKQLTGRGSRRRGIFVKPHRGYFVDVKTLAASLTSKSHTLAVLTSHLKSKTRKVESERHGEVLTTDYLGYAAADVQATWECFKELSQKYEAHGLHETPAYLIKSEASIGKAYLKEMGVRPWREAQPDFPSAQIGKIMSAYCGGRSEVRIRRTITEVEYCDFLSMYPTVCTLMGLWKFVISDGVTPRDSTLGVRHLLETVCIEDLQRPDTWKMLRTLVRVQPNADIFPVRARYGHEAQKTIGLNYLTSNQPLWFTLADCIASKLLTGKVPKIIEAIAFIQGQDQLDLRAVQVGGEHGTAIDPKAHDFYRTLIDQRTTLKAKLKEANEQEREVLDAEQMAIKILANSTSYGIFIEVNVEEAAETQELTCHGFDGRSFGVRKAKVEKPGKYFHPLLAVLTGCGKTLPQIGFDLIP